MISMEDTEKIMEAVFTECRNLRVEGQNEYAHDPDNALRNFEATGQDIGISREKVLWIFAKKHFDGVAAWIKGHRSQRENVRGRINDMIVYLCLLRCMVEDEVLTAQLEDDDDTV